MKNTFSRRSFFKTAALGAGLAALAGKATAADEKPIQGFEDTKTNTDATKAWTPVSDRKIRMGIVGYGVCKFGAAFGLQNHPNVEVVAVSDLIPDRCKALAEACHCEKTYPSLEELIKDTKIEAVFVATDAPSHARHCIDVLKHGKHVASAVPAAFGSLEDADRLYETVKTSGLNYMMFETTCFHDDCYAMRQIYNGDGFGKMIYTEGEYYHYFGEPLDSYNGWRIGLPPQWYPTHSNGYYTCVTGGSFTEVTCFGMPSIIPHLQPANNVYKNPFGSEIALFRTSEGGMARMAVCWDTPGNGGEMGRVRGQKGSMVKMSFDGISDISKINLVKPALPPNVDAGGHGGSHGYLGNEFVTSILQERKPLVNIAWALNMTVSGIIAHQSALKDGERMKIPQYAF
ncbi:MAG TPA: Gfo/Idh/MocA family oxidoreductase [Candidatus Hydrogenedentes bacterium]|nr:Gfo/Idh/MocA family oxidoreductase [Candidatus Hydrogenedentota bacterium]